VPGMRFLMSHVPMTRGMVRSSLRQFGLRRAIDSGAFDDDMLDWAHSLLRDTHTLRNDLRSSPRVVTPIAGHNTDLLLSDELLQRLTMPTLFIWGEDDPNGGAEVALDFVPRLPDGRLVLVPGGEHAPWLDDLERCVEETSGFLDAASGG
jgi:pimeloyl-ACP methyl ester carboxylesterase